MWSHPETSPWNVISGLYRKAGIAHGAIIIKSKLPEFSLHFPGVLCSLQWALRRHGYYYKHFTPLKLITSQLQYRHTLPGNSATDSFLTPPAKSKMWFETHSSFLRQTEVWVLLTFILLLLIPLPALKWWVSLRVSSRFHSTKSHLSHITVWHHLFSKGKQISHGGPNAWGTVLLHILSGKGTAASLDQSNHCTEQDQPVPWGPPGLCSKGKSSLGSVNSCSSSLSSSL